jgi:proteasome lid subunit RPN8/RPN11
MLTIPRALYDKVVAHARADHPDEACGVIAGPAGSDRPDTDVKDVDR